VADGIGSCVSFAGYTDWDPAESQVNRPLFRPEVIAQRQTQWLGTVLLATRISHRLFAIFALLTAAAVLSLLFFATYTRKARINGWLVPQQGLVRIFAPQSAVVTQLYVHEGDEVREGAPLLELSTELRSKTMGATEEEIAHRLILRRDSLIGERGLQQRLFEQNSRDMSERLTALRSEQEHLARELELQRTRSKLTEAFTARQRDLRDRGLNTEQRLQAAEENRLEQALQVRALERAWVTTQRERLTLESELRDLPLNSQTRLAEIDRNIATLEQELAETEARRRIVLVAPHEGTVTAIQAEPGGRADTAFPLLSIVPLGSKLEAQLFSPSRAIGFVRPGQRVLLRYQAFPYQKFGHYEGIVASVSRSAVSPGELTQQLVNLASLYGQNEAVYRITVSLASQTVKAYGEAIPLQPGMQLEAAVLIESRPLIEWVFDPLFTVTGSWRG
jgi:membrane fusion protein